MHVHRAGAAEHIQRMHTDRCIALHEPPEPHRRDRRVLHEPPEPYRARADGGGSLACVCGRMTEPAITVAQVPEEDEPSPKTAQMVERGASLLGQEYDTYVCHAYVYIHMRIRVCVRESTHPYQHTHTHSY